MFVYQPLAMVYDLEQIGYALITGDLESFTPYSDIGLAAWNGAGTIDILVGMVKGIGYVPIEFVRAIESGDPERIGAATLNAALLAYGACKAVAGIRGALGGGRLGRISQGGVKAKSLRSSFRKLVGNDYPTKLNRGGKLQPYDPKTGRFLSYSSNPGLKLSPLTRFTSGFAQGWAEAKGATGATPVGSAGNIGYIIGNAIGSLLR
ncbi:MAG TPA: hypothetical protein ENI41_09025 [Deltaproteobacteria bacterium]|nr:hypothetical protein [Deltaproteobacteria bacterium]